MADEQSPDWQSSESTATGSPCTGTKAASWQDEASSSFEQRSMPHSRCQEALKWTLAQPRIAAMMDAMKSTGDFDVVAKDCTVSSGNAHCKIRGYFMFPPGDTVVLCCNNLSGKDEMLEVAQHELTHAYDARVSGLDLRVAQLLACSEVHAATAADCRRVIWPFKESCIRNAAVTSVNVNFSKEVAIDAVDAVFDRCFKEKVPPPKLDKQ